MFESKIRSNGPQVPALAKEQELCVPSKGPARYSSTYIHSSRSTSVRLLKSVRVGNSSSRKRPTAKDDTNPQWRALQNPFWVCRYNSKKSSTMTFLGFLVGGSIGTGIHMFANAACKVPLSRSEFLREME